MSAYRHVRIQGDKIEGELQSFGDSWIKFSGSAPLMRIHHACDEATPEVRTAIWALQDGYGPTGFTPAQGWDWSGVRDSGDAAKRAMDFVARSWWAEMHPGELWPWERPAALAVDRGQQALDLLQSMFDGWEGQLDRDRNAEINGGDCVEWFCGFWKEARKIVPLEGRT